MTHYYNLVLNKLSQMEDVELKLVVPKQVSSHIGDGVYQTREGVSFKIIELEEFNLFGLFPSFRGLVQLFLSEKPDIVITADTYIFTFVLNIPVVLTKKLLGIKLIMKSIPFRIPTYQEAKRQVNENAKRITRIPGPLNTLLLKLGMLKRLRIAVIQLNKFAFNVPDAHVNYVDNAFTIYGSYGVAPSKIFITRNSPDTDLLCSIRESIKPDRAILPACEHRLVHVGRLVAWKRVDMLLRAFARIKQRFDDAELLIIGIGPEEEMLKNLSVALQIDHCVRFLGGVYDPRRLGQYLLSSKIYVLAGMGGLSINEAMCFGLPIICAIGDGTEKKLVYDNINGKYFIDGNEDDLTAKIEYLFSHPALMRQMGIKSTEIIRDEINIHTVIEGYRKAFTYVHSSLT